MVDLKVPNFGDFTSLLCRDACCTCNTITFPFLTNDTKGTQRRHQRQKVRLVQEVENEGTMRLFRLRFEFHSPNFFFSVSSQLFHGSPILNHLSQPVSGYFQTYWKTCYRFYFIVKTASELYVSQGMDYGILSE